MLGATSALRCLVGEFMLRTIATFVLSLTLAASASAQTAANPVIEHFRAYRAALAQGDLAAADTAATAALAASEAQDGDGGRTAILALNLASLRLERGDRAGARAPAQRAHALASRSDANIDPLLARLVLARAELNDADHTRNGLRGVLQEAAAREDLKGEVHLGAADLGRADFSTRDYANSAAAWTLAASTSDAAPGDASIARARALTAEAVANIYISMRRGRTRLSTHDETANARLVEAMELLMPMARAEAPRGLGEAARALSDARAWSSALWATLVSAGIEPAWPTPRAANIMSGERQLCWLRLHTDPIPAHPGARDFSVGAVGIALQTNGEGEIIAREVISTAPTSADFARAVENVYERWRIEWRTDGPPDCTRRALILLSEPFWLDGGEVRVVRGRPEVSAPPRPSRDGGDEPRSLPRVYETIPSPR